MNTLILVLKIFPLILAAVQAVEQAIPLPGQGNKKLGLVLDVLKFAFDGTTDLANQFNWDKLVALVVPMITKIVDLLNALGLFQKSASGANEA